jgi:DnaD/phage-associated family protein
MEEQQRQFKGIWIPKEIWLNKDLTFQEKIILVEIDSYDDGQVGCFATNKHFVNNFGINSSRISQIIQSLQRKNYITITYDFNGKEIIKRYLHINRPPYPPKEGMLKINIGMLKNEMGVCQFDKGGYVKKLKDNNTNINNTNNNNNNYNYIYNNSSSSDEIINFIESNFGRTLSYYEFEKINCWLNEFNSDIVKHAIELSILNNKRTFAYIEGILKNWKSCGYKTLDDIKNEDVTPKPKTKEELKKEYAKMGYIYE